MPKFIKVKCIIEKVEDDVSNNKSDSSVINTYEDFEAKTKEKKLISIKSCIDISKITAFTEFVTEDGNIDQDLTLVYTDADNLFCVDFPFEKFEEIYYDFPMCDLLEEEQKET